MSEPKNRESLLLPILIPLGALVVIALALFGFSRILLSISHHAATAVALGAAVSIMGIASFLATRKRVSSSSLAGLTMGVLGSCMLIGGVAIVAVGPEKEAVPTAQTQVLALTAPVGAAATGFEPAALSAAPGAPIRIELDNQETGVSHNVAVYASDPTKDPGAALLGSVEPAPGPAKLTVNVKALAAGAYFFRCDVHPATMNGVLTVAEGGGTAGGGVSVSAKNLQFSTDKIALPASQPTSIAFDNQDVGTPHNIAIYSDQGYTKEIFKGEIITGPLKTTYDVQALDAGTYYFRCDVHTTMIGTVVVGGKGNGSTPSPTTPTGSEPPPTTAPPPTAEPGGGGASASISASGLQFDTSSLSFPAGKSVALAFDNMDAGTPHNVAIYSDSGYATEIFKGEIITGPTKTTYAVPALDAGTYYFKCDVHPTMTGTVTVK